MEEINQTLEVKLPIELKEKCSLYGNEGSMDSIALVSLVVSVEQNIEEQFGLSIILASEKAMSQRNSPFLTVGSLAKFSESLIQEAISNE